MNRIPSFQFRPKYVSFDCYGTLIEWPMNPITHELVGDQIPAEEWDQFVSGVPRLPLRPGPRRVLPLRAGAAGLLRAGLPQVGCEGRPGRGQAVRRRRPQLGAPPGRGGAAEEDGRALQAGDPLQRRRLLPAGERAPARCGLPRGLHRGAGRLLQAPLRGVRVHARPARRVPRGLRARLLAHPLRPPCRCTTWASATSSCWTAAATR